MLFAQYMDKSIEKKLRENLSGKYSQKLLNYAKQSVIDALETASEIEIQKPEEENGDLISNKKADKIIGTASRSVLELIHKQRKSQ